MFNDLIKPLALFQVLPVKSLLHGQSIHLHNVSLFDQFYYWSILTADDFN